MIWSCITDTLFTMLLMASERFIGSVTPLSSRFVCLELDEVCLVRFDIVAELLRRVLLRETVGVVAVRQQQNLHVHTLGQQHVDAAD